MLGELNSGLLTTQPTANVGIHRGSPLAGGLIHAFVPGIGDIATQKSVAPRSDGSIVASGVGATLRGNGSPNVLSFPANLQYTALTVTILMSADNWNYCHIFELTNGASGGFIFFAGTGGADKGLRLNHTGSTTNEKAYGSANLPSTGVYHAYSCVYDFSGDASNEVDLYIDGALQSHTALNVGGNNASSAVHADSTLYVFSRANSLYPVTGNLAVMLIHDHRLTAQEVRSLHANPWQGFRAVPHDSVFFPSGGTSGELAASGGSTTTGTAQPAVAYSVSAAAVLATSGSAGPAAAINPQAIDLVVTSGAANPSVSGTVNAAADGSSGTSGAAQPSVSMTIAAAAVIQSLGQAGVSPYVLLNAAHTALTSGNADIAVAALAAAAGSATSTGNAALAAQINALASGVVTVSGIANLASGNQQFGNAAGSVVTTGAAGATLAFTLSADGSDESGGAVVGTLNVDLTAAGIIQMAGAGVLIVTAPLVAFGAVTTGGAANLVEVGAVVLIPDPRYTVKASRRSFRVRL